MIIPKSRSLAQGFRVSRLSAGRIDEVTAAAFDAGLRERARAGLL
jgi:hypothetical protein